MSKGKAGSDTVENVMDFEALAYNIKKYRKLKHISQKQLAELFHVTPQAISKWERNISIPDLYNVVRLAEVFQISIDELLDHQRDNRNAKVFIGIDSTGTESEYIMFYENGSILKRVTGNGCNPNMIGMSSAIKELKKGIDELMLGEDIRLSAIYAGVSGCIGNYHKIMAEELQRFFPYVKIKVTYDGENLADSFGNLNHTILVNCKSGSVVFAKEGKSMHRIGGWGFLLDDPACDFRFGRDALKAALAEEDGVGPKTVITEIIHQKLGSGVWENIPMIYAKEYSYVADFADCVFQAYQMGDEVAKQILDDNYHNLARYIKAALKFYKEVPPIVLSGKIGMYREITEEFMKKYLSGTYTWMVCDMPKVYGACRKCCELFGSYSEEFKNNFLKDYTDY